MTAIIQRSEKYFVALCPELDVVSQGKTVEKAHANITEAVELFPETASPAELKQRLHTETLHLGNRLVTKIDLLHRV